MAFPQDLTEWRSTLGEALGRAQQIANEHGLEMPTERLVRSWRTSGLLSKDGRQFTGHNILEMLRIRQLRDNNLPFVLIQQDLRRNSEELWVLLTGEATPPTPPVAPAPETDESFLDETVALLAAGLLRQYKDTGNGKIVGIIADLPTELRQAQAYLARLALRAGEEDRFASVHHLIHACMRPMREWAPAPLSTHPEYQDVTLITQEYRVPTEDCDRLARKSGRVDNLLETRRHADLMRTLGTLPPEEQAQAYTLIRHFLAKHPLATEEELRGLLLNPRLNAPLRALVDGFYQPVHQSQRRGTDVVRCAHCGSPMDTSGRCVLASCRSRHKVPAPGPSLPAATARVARPELLQYWVDPAQEELRLYRELVDAGLPDVRLYPHLDRCDVSLGDHTGVDVKDHANPQRLGKTLSESIGGLREYHPDRRFLAVADRRAEEDQYLDRLKEHLTSTQARQLKVMSVTQTIAYLKRFPHA